MKNFTEFNIQAADYAKYRPTYPKELFEFIVSNCATRSLAYDVGTGNGQCAIDLAKYFEKVLASDLSYEQIANAIQRNNITYFVSEAHESNIKSSSVDLITIATAIHWFDFEKFYLECNRILKKDGILAAWSYGWHECEKKEITDIIQKIGKVILKDYWSSQPKLIWNEYQTIPFPFLEIKHPKFQQTLQWNMHELIGYLTTWSATQKYIKSKNSHPVEEVIHELQTTWGDPFSKKQFTCPLFMRLGKKNS